TVNKESRSRSQNPDQAAGWGHTVLSVSRRMPWRLFIGLLAGAALVVAVVYVVFWPASDVIARHDVGAITRPRDPAVLPQHAAALRVARDAARGRLLAFGTGVFAALALFYTARNFTLSRRTVELTLRTVQLTEQGQVTDRYTKAVDQLGAERRDVRIGGIY